MRLAGTLVTTDAAGTERRTPFARSLRALHQVFGGAGGSLTAIDEQLRPGAWASGGDLALASADQSFG